MSIFASYDKVFQPVFYQFTLLKLFRKEKKISGSFPSRLHDFPRKARREKLSFQIAPNTQRSSKFSHWCPYLQVMIKFSNLCFITLPCWNSSGKRKRALEAFHSWLLDFPRKARRENTSCSKYLFDGLTSDCCWYKPSSSKTREPLTCHCLLSLERTF